MDTGWDYVFHNSMLDEGDRLSTNGIINFSLFELIRNGGYKTIDELRNVENGKWLHLPVPHIDYVDNSTLNACAFQANNRDFIAINGGTILILHEVFYRMLANPDVLPFIGNASLEIPLPKLFSAGVDILDASTITRSPIEESFIPKDMVRMCYAQNLAQTALRFLILHEYAHLIFGHVDLLCHKVGIAKMFELNGDGHTSGFDGMTSQTIEMDADCYATNKSIMRVLRMYQLRDQLSPAILDFYDTEEKAIFNFTFAISTLFNIFSLGPIDWNNLESCSHPPAGVRLHIAFATMHTVLQPIDLKLANASAKVAVESIEFSMKAFATLFEEGFDINWYLQTYRGVGMAHFKKIHSNWKNVRPELERFSRSNLAPIGPDLK